MSRRRERSVVAEIGGTRPRPVDEAGRELDEWGLPLLGPARARRLAELGKPDPNEAPEAWSAPVEDLNQLAADHRAAQNAEIEHG